jgi:hypothetical protein
VPPEERSYAYRPAWQFHRAAEMGDTDEGVHLYRPMTSTYSEQ